MKKEIIKTQDYLLVVDDLEIKDDDWFYNPFKKMISINSNPDGCYKIIFHLPLNDSPILEGVPLLPPLEVEDDVEMMAEEEYPIIPYTSPNINWDRANKQEGFESGYNKAREKYKFTEEDVRKALWELGDVLFNNNQNGIEENEPEEYFDGIIQDLSQPKTSTPPHFEFEMEDKVALDGHTVIGKEIKTTTNSQGQQVACGKYIY